MVWGSVGSVWAGRGVGSRQGLSSVVLPSVSVAVWALQNFRLRAFHLNPGGLASPNFPEHPFVKAPGAPWSPPAPLRVDSQPQPRPWARVTACHTAEPTPALQLI